MKIARISFVAILVSMLTLSACIETGPTPLDIQNREDDLLILAYVSSLETHLSKDIYGIYRKRLLTENANPKLEEQDLLKINYEIRVMGNPVALDSVMNPDEPVVIRYDDNKILPVGLFLAMKWMRVGEMYHFIIPSSLALDNISVDDAFDAYSIIEIKIHVLEKVEEQALATEELAQVDAYFDRLGIDESQISIIENDIRVYVSDTGTGVLSIDPTINVRIQYEAFYSSGIPFDSTSGDGTVTFVAGDAGDEFNVGLEKGLEQIKEGGSAIIGIPSHAGFYDSVAFVIPSAIQLPGYSLPLTPVIYDVNLIDLSYD